MSGDGRGEDGSFESRLQAARSRQGMDASPGGPEPRGPEVVSRQDATSPMGVGLRVGVELVSAVAVGIVIGWGLDRWLHTLPLFLCVFVLVGGAAGFANVWRLLGRPRQG